MRDSRRGITSLLVVAVVVMALAVLYARRSPGAEAALPPTPVPLPSPAVQPPTPRAGDPDRAKAGPPEGIPAIRPSRPAVGPDEPTFTADDVRAFIAAHGLDYGRMQPAGPYQIEGVEFVTSAEAARRLEVRSGRPDTAPLCLVTIRGTFRDAGGPPPNPQTGAPSTGTFSTMVLVFDARTGNLVRREGLP